MFDIGRSLREAVVSFRMGIKQIVHLTMSDDFPFSQAFVVIESCSRRSLRLF
ncbi:hypothetical protein [Candidatus Liberibacter sp.]|uniref:hypothetical protein n=1 Tax=Candidatus Liberibacter sp. TaxID=34022 RepID=UPI001C713353|nr:hypothetical protein [Candidatus Liberibacter sp.]